MLRDLSPELRAPEARTKLAYLDGDAVRWFVKERGTNLALLAEAVGTTPAYLATLMSGKIGCSDELAAKLGDALGAPADELTRVERKRPPRAEDVDAPRVRDLIRARGATQAEAAEKMGYSPAYFSQVLTGRQPASKAFVRKLADVLGVPTEEVLSNGEPLPPEDVGVARPGRPAEPPRFVDAEKLEAAIEASGLKISAQDALGISEKKWLRAAFRGEACPNAALRRAASVIGTTVEAISSTERPAGRSGRGCREVDGARFRAALEASGKSLAEVASAIGTSVATLSGAISGRTTLADRLLVAAARELEIDWSELLLNGVG